MRTIVLILLLGITTSCLAQKVAQIGDKTELRVNKETVYLVERLENKLIMLHNKKDPGLSSESWSVQSAIKFDKQKLMDMVWEVFGEKRLIELEKERSIIAIIYFNRNGKVQSITYGVKSDSPISLSELAQLEKSIKSDIDFSEFVNDENRSYDSFSTSVSFSFKRILKRQLWGTN